MQVSLLHQNCLFFANILYQTFELVSGFHKASTLSKGPLLVTNDRHLEPKSFKRPCGRQSQLH